jgi:hypothetical protein
MRKHIIKASVCCIKRGSSLRRLTFIMQIFESLLTATHLGYKLIQKSVVEVVQKHHKNRKSPDTDASSLKKTVDKSELDRFVTYLKTPFERSCLYSVE